jgi:EmrB/QacA subfamily drug resistance transporter
MTRTAPVYASEEQADPRRWFAAAVVIVSVLIPVLDNTVLNVAIPAILREFHTDLPSLQWVITGYSLTFATLLIIGGRLGDVYGHRRLFIIGAAIFGGGSLLASVSTSVPTLFLGEALIEGIGASMMIPATLSILSTTFRGPERAKAFAAWGAVAGAAVAFGPVVGGFLTTDYSWRWAFRINVIVAPLIVAGALLFMRADERPTRRPRIDIPGAVMIAAGSFALIFGLSEGGTYGWWKPLKDLTVAGASVWPASRHVSAVPLAFAFAAVVLAAFVVYERAKERAHADPLFEFGQLRHLGFRYGLLTTMVLAMGQFGLLFVLPVLLQDGARLSALETGEWMIPMGVLIALGAPIGARLTRVIDTTVVVRLGLALEAIGLATVAFSITSQPTFLQILPGSVLFGLGVGFASSQLTNVILSDIEPDKAGVASGSNATVRQVGLALGIATFASLLNVQTIRHAVDAVRKFPGLSDAAKSRVVAQLHAKGVAFDPRTIGDRARLHGLDRLMGSAVADGARPALLFASGVVAVGTLLSFLIPRVGTQVGARGAMAVEMVDAYEQVDIDPASAV